MNSELAKARKELEDAQKELDRKVGDYNAQIAAAEQKIKNGENELRNGEIAIRNGESQINEKEAVIRDAESKLKKVQETLKLIDEKLPEAKEYIKKMMDEYQGKLDESLEEILKVQKLLDKLKDLDPESEEFRKLSGEVADFIITHEKQMKKVQNFFKKDEVMDAAEKLRDVTGIDATDGIKKIRALDLADLCDMARTIKETGGDFGGFIDKVRESVKLYEDELKTLEEFDSYIKEYEEKRGSLYAQVADKEGELKAGKLELDK